MGGGEGEAYSVLTGGGDRVCMWTPFDDVHEDREGLGFHLVDAVVVAENRPSAPPRVQKAI